MGWRRAAASRVTAARRSQIWDASQVLSKKALLAAFKTFQPATLTIIITEEMARINKALADSGEAIRTRMQTVRSCVTVGQEFDLSATAIRWILAEVEKGNKARLGPSSPEKIQKSTLVPRDENGETAGQRNWRLELAARKKQHTRSVFEKRTTGNEPLSYAAESSEPFILTDEDLEFMPGFREHMERSLVAERPPQADRAQMSGEP